MKTLVTLFILLLVTVCYGDIEGTAYMSWSPVDMTVVLNQGLPDANNGFFWGYEVWIYKGNIEDNDTVIKLYVFDPEYSYTITENATVNIRVTSVYSVMGVNGKPFRKNLGYSELHNINFKVGTTNPPTNLEIQ